MDIPLSLSCNTLEEVVSIAVNGFADMKSTQVKEAITYLKHYFNYNYHTTFNGGAMISLPHKTDPWYPIDNMVVGSYMVVGRFSGNYCHSRWLFRVVNDSITYIDQYDVECDSV